MAYPQTLGWLLRSQNADGSFKPDEFARIAVEQSCGLAASHFELLPRDLADLMNAGRVSIHVP